MFALVAARLVRPCPVFVCGVTTLQAFHHSWLTACFHLPCFCPWVLHLPSQSVCNTARTHTHTHPSKRRKDSKRTSSLCMCICVISNILPFKRDFLLSSPGSEGLCAVWSSIIMFLVQMPYMNSLFILLRLFIPTYFLPITPYTAPTKGSALIDFGNLANTAACWRNSVMHNNVRTFRIFCHQISGISYISTNCFRWILCKLQNLFSGCAEGTNFFLLFKFFFVKGKQNARHIKLTETSLA